MRKIPRDFENPIDDIIIEICDKICPPLRKMGLTPNIITTFGLISRLISIYYLLQNRKWLFLFYGTLGYFFDCLDGHMARKYDMCTTFGDYYDHISDTVYVLALMYILFNYSKLSRQGLFVVVLVIAITYFGMLFHMGCQENIHLCEGDACSGFLSSFKDLCPNGKNINVSKYFGCGTSTLIIYALFFFIPFNKVI